MRRFRHEGIVPKILSTKCIDYNPVGRGKNDGTALRRYVNVLGLLSAVVGPHFRRSKPGLTEVPAGSIRNRSGGTDDKAD